MDVHASIDWLSMTIHDRLYVTPKFMFGSDWEDTGSIRGYTAGRQSNLGVREYVNGRREDMGIHTVIAGKAFQNILDNGMTSWDVLQSCARRGYRFTRTDIAIDVMDGEIDIGQLYDQCISGNVVTRTNRFAITRDHDKEGVCGEGLYVGSRKNRAKLLCVYNKALELDLDRYRDHKRIELRLYGDYATNGGRYLGECENAANEALGIVKAFCHFPEDNTWNSIFDVEPVKIAPRQNGKSDRQKWLLNTVARSIAKEILLSGEPFVADMRDSISLALEELRQESEA